MNNFLATPQIFAGLVMMDLGGALHVCENMSHAVDKEFAKKNNKIGAQVMVRRPYRFTVSSGIIYDPQPLADTAMPVTISQTAQVGYDWDAIEKTLSLREMQELYSKPAAMALASKINAAAATFAADNTFNSVGTPGTAPTDDLAYLSAGDLIVAMGMPEDEELKLIVNRRMSSAFVHGTKTLFNPTGAISAQWKQGTMVDSLGYSVYRDQTINTHTVGTYSGSPIVHLGNQQADGANNATMTLNTQGWGSGVTTLNRGDKFVIGSASSATVGGVMSVHPQTRLSTGYQQQFTVVNTISDTAGTINMVVFPAITPYGQYQNVDSSPVDTAIITMVGASGVSAQQGLLMHKNAFAFVSVPLNGPDPGMGALVTNVRDPETGIALQLTKAFDSINHREINKILVLFDFAKLYPEMACVVQA
jgi:hypothetical protein